MVWELVNQRSDYIPSATGEIMTMIEYSVGDIRAYGRCCESVGAGGTCKNLRPLYIAPQSGYRYRTELEIKETNTGGIVHTIYSGILNTPITGSSGQSSKAITLSNQIGYTATVRLMRELIYIPTPPPTPSSISIPTIIKVGESITISWGSSLGATRYHLERSVNGGSFAQIYQGVALSYTDAITKGWNTVAYRVRAYNSDGYSSYRTSPTRTVINFPKLDIKVNGILKISDNGWVRINGQLKEIDSIKMRVNGTLKEV